MLMKTYSAAEMADILHQASMLYMSSNIPIDYGTGQKYTPVEVHMLEYIINNPGKMTTELSAEWDKTKAAISQMMKKMEEKGLVTHREAHDSRKKQLYYATPYGEELNRQHLAYDERVFGRTLDLMREECSEEEILQCFSTLQKFCRARRKKHYRSSED